MGSPTGLIILKKFFGKIVYHEVNLGISTDEK